MYQYIYCISAEFGRHLHGGMSVIEGVALHREIQYPLSLGSPRGDGDEKAGGKNGPLRLERPLSF